MNSPAATRSRPLVTHLPLALLALAVLLYAGYFAYLTLLRYHAFEARALDLGNLNQAIWNTAHGSWFRMTNQEPGLTSRLSYHVEPILLLIAPFYLLQPGPEFLLVLQAVVVALGAVPLFFLARRQQLGDWMGLLFGVAFLLNPTVQAANWLEFHPLTLAPTLLLAAFYFLVAGRTGWFALFAVLSATCKEEIGLLVFMMGLFAWLALKRRRLGWVTMALSLGWSLFAVLGIQALAGSGNIHWGRYDYLGRTALDKLLAPVTRPAVVAGQLQQAGVLRYLFELLLPVGFTALLAPEVLALALPSFAINLLADFAPMHQVTTLIYAAPIVPFVLAAGVMGVARLLRRARRQPAQQRARWVQGTAAVLVLGGALVSQRLYGYLPGSGHALELVVTDHHRRAQAIIDQIPAAAVVSAQDRLNPHVSGRSSVYIFPRVDDADTVFIDVTGPAWPQHPSDLQQQVQGLLAQGFGVAAADDGYLLLRKGEPNRRLPAAFYQAWTSAPAPLADAVPISTTVRFGDALELQGYAVGRDRNGELVVDTTWQALKPLDGDLRFYVGYADGEGNVLHDSVFYPSPAELWYPTSSWQPGQPVHVRSLPWTLGTDRFGLVLGVYAGEGGWSSGGRLPVTAGAAGLPVLENGTAVRLGGFAQQSSGSWASQPMAAQLAAWQPRNVRFGDTLELAGAVLPEQVRAGQPLTLTLTWQVQQPAAADLVRFVHVLDAGGSKVAQVDGPPGDAIGRLPLSAWPAGWRGDDTVAVTLPATLAAGEYSVIAGWYDWQTGKRLPAAGANAAPGDAAQIGKIRIQQ